MPNNSSEGKTAMNYEDNKNLEGEFLEYALTLELAEETKMSFLELKALKDGIDVFKAIKEIKDGSTHIDLQRTILTMDRALFELEKELLAKEKENESLKKQIASINKPKVVEQLIAKDSLWFVKDDNSQLPVCRSCTDKENRFVYMSKSDMIPTGVLSGKEYKCPECKILISVLDEIVYSPSFIVH